MNEATEVDGVVQQQDGEVETERVTLVRDVFAGGQSTTETIEADIVWICGRPTGAMVLGKPAHTSNWSIAKRLGMQLIAARPQPVKGAEPVEAQPEQVTPAEEKPAKPEDPQEEKALKGYDHYAGTHKKGAEVVVIRIDNHDIAMGIKLRMKGAVKKREGDMPLVEFEGVSDGPHTMGDSQLIPAADYKGRVYKVKA